MSDNLSTKYNPQEVEAGRYQEWLAKRSIQTKW